MQEAKDQGPERSKNVYIQSVFGVTAWWNDLPTFIRALWLTIFSVNATGNVREVSCMNLPAVACGRREIVRFESHNFPHPERIACCSAPNSRPPSTKALHTICGNNTSIVSSSRWWAYKCPKHVERIICAIKHSVASSWFSSLRLYYDARTNIRQRYGEYS